LVLAVALVLRRDSDAARLTTALQRCANTVRVLSSFEWKRGIEVFSDIAV
jgi:hypothetical protein